MNRRERTLQSLAGLSVGDAFGEQFFRTPRDAIAGRRLPAGQWRWTDDTQMALSIVEVLLEHGRINQDALARSFAGYFERQPGRGYGGGARRLLSRLSQGADWRAEAPRLFDGGSYGNGGAMRAAPVGAFYAGAPQQAAREGAKSAEITHAHPEGQAGAIAVAVAAALIAADQPPAGKSFLQAVRPYVPDGKTRAGITAALDIDGEAHQEAISALGTGQQVAAFDTVPYCLWVVAHHAPDFETALWTTVAGGGDRDTTCAIVGGIVAARLPVPDEWLARREPLPAEFRV